MKMTREHYADLKQHVKEIADQLPAHYAALVRQHQNPNPRFPVIKDLDRRFLWDVFYASRIQNKYTYQEFDYTGAHIETAMRAVLRELNLPGVANERKR